MNQINTIEFIWDCEGTFLFSVWFYRYRHGYLTVVVVHVHYAGEIKMVINIVCRLGANKFQQDK